MACYFPDGALSPGDKPCQPDARDSACCTESSYCLTNGLCMGSDGGLSRGSCTDVSWDSPECAQYCKRVNPSGGMALFSCAFDSGGVNYTCGTGVECENAFKISRFEFVMRDFQLERTIQNSQTGNESLSLSASGASGPSSSAIAIADNNAGETPDCGAGYSSGAMAGVGVGVGLPLLIAILALLFLLRRQKRIVNTEIITQTAPRQATPPPPPPITYTSGPKVPLKDETSLAVKSYYGGRSDRKVTELGELGEEKSLHELDSGYATTI